MTDIVDRKTRSRMMAGIRGSDTKPEWIVRRGLYRRGFRYRLHVSSLAGRPDLVLRSRQAVVFIHGCFWHGHDCGLFRWPATRRDFWANKISGNQARDEKVISTLLAQHWRVAVIWECALRGKGRLSESRILDGLEVWIRSDEPRLELHGATFAG